MIGGDSDACPALGQSVALRDAMYRMPPTAMPETTATVPPPSGSTEPQPAALPTPVTSEAAPFQQFATTEGTLSFIAVVGTEVVGALMLAALVYALAAMVLGRLAGLGAKVAADVANSARLLVRNLLLLGTGTTAIALVAGNTWLAWRGHDVKRYTMDLISSISAETWMGLGLAVGKLALAAIAAVVVTRILRKVLRWLEAAINRWDQLKDNDKSLAAFFAGIDRAVANTGWLLVAVFACLLFSLPAVITEWVTIALRIYLIITIGVLIVRATAVIVDTLDGLSRLYAESRNWLRYYDHLKPLVPVFRRCLEFALWIATASLALEQLPALDAIAVWGPRLIKAIGIFFLGRVVIEVGHLLIASRLLPPEGLDEVQRRRRATVAPLVGSIFSYAAYFTIAVLMLSAVGFEVMPLLAGAGIFGLVIGFGSQSLVNDVVSGFFILFENVYLVGDQVEAGGGKGVVEAIEFRTTRIRDSDGRVHIIRNGDVKQVINYSKDYSRAVVPVDVGYDADLRAVFATLVAAGETVRAGCADVLAPLEVEGITGFSGSALTVRTTTKVKAGQHDAVAAKLRLAFKEAFDRMAAGAPRKGLVPDAPRPLAG